MRSRKRKRSKWILAPYLYSPCNVLLIVKCSRQRCQTAVQIINNLIPGFQDKVANCDDLTLYLSPVSSNLYIIDLLVADILNKLQTGANDARSDDAGRIKVAVANWLNARKPYRSEIDDSNRNTATPIQVLSPKGKEGRRISNNVTGRLICPIEYDWDDPEYVASLQPHPKMCF